MTTGRPLDVTAVVAFGDAAAAAGRFEPLVAQTLGAGRLEVVAVAADAAGDDIDRFAEKHPEVIRVVRPDASGAAALNAALECAEGRYVCFLGPGDRLDPAAFERLALAADEAGAGVLVCGSDEAWDLAAARFFRRDLLEGLRFEGPELCAHERFALQAMARADRVLTLPGERALGPAERPEAAPAAWVEAAERLAGAADGLLDGDAREALLLQVFRREIDAALDPRALRLGAFDRAEQWQAAADFADARLTEAIRRRLPTDLRVRVSLAQRRDLELLEAALAAPAPRLLLEDGRLYLRYPGFREAGEELPDDWFEAGEDRLTDCLARGTEPRYLVWTGVKRADYRLEYSFALPVEGIDPDAVRVGAVRIESGRPAPAAAHPADAAPALDLAAEVAVRAEDGTAVVTARLLLPDLTARPPGRWSLRAAVAVGGVVYDLPLAAPEGYVRKEGMLRGVTVEWTGAGEPGRALVVRVRELATLKGFSRLKALLANK